MLLANANVPSLTGGSTPDRRTLLVRDGRIAEPSEARASDHVVDLSGCTVLPGFVDAHVHFRPWAESTRTLRLDGCRSRAELLERVADAAAAEPSSSWLYGSGWDDGSLGDPATDPDAQAQLSAVVGDRPTVLHSRDGHGIWTTNATLLAARTDPHTIDVAGGIVERTRDGRFAGVVREESVFTLRRSLPPSTLNADALVDAMRRAAMAGVVRVHDMDGGDALAAWCAAASSTSADLPLSARVYLHPDDLDRLDALRAMVATVSGVTIGGLKLFADGTLGSGTALLHEPELARPGVQPRAGVAVLARDELEAQITRAAVLGLGTAVHAIGDRAVTTVLDAFERTRGAWTTIADAPRIEHAQLVQPDDLYRAAALGVTLVVQPTMLVTDRDEADARWGPHRTPHAFALRAMLDAGCRIRLSSDAPIEELAPLAAIHAATVRDGGAHGLAPARGAWHPEQSISVLDAVRASVVASAIRVGDSADLVALDGDPLSGSIAHRRIVATIRAGRVTWDGDARFAP